MVDFLPYGRQCIDEADIAAVAAVLRGDWLTTGPAVDAFEAAFARAVDADFAVACSSGTAALHLAALALELGPGDAVIVPAVTFVASANAARYVGAEVVFADVEPDTGLMGPAQLEGALTRAPRGSTVRAIFPVHLNGQCADPTAMKAVADAHGLKIVEDACHSLGATYDKGIPVGAAHHADLATFSFHPVKTIVMGEGGAITGRDRRLEKRLRSLRNHGLIRDPAGFTMDTLARNQAGAVNPWHYELHELGFNYRASDINCALGLSQLAKLGHFVERRRALATRYDERLRPLANAVRPIGRMTNCVPAWHLYVVLVDFANLGVDRATVVEKLRAKGVGSQVHYTPVAWQPYYRARYGELSLPGAAAYFDRCLSLPLFPSMADSDVDRVVEALAEIVAA